MSPPFVDITTASAIVSCRSCHVITSVPCSFGTAALLVALLTGVEALSGNWRSDVCWLTHMGNRIITIGWMFSSLSSEKKYAGLRTFFRDTDCSSFEFYRIVYKADHSLCQYSGCLSTVRCYLHRRQIGWFRCDCHGLHVDTGCFVKGRDHCSREGRVCRQTSCVRVWLSQGQTLFSVLLTAPHKVAYV